MKNKWHHYLCWVMVMLIAVAFSFPLKTLAQNAGTITGTVSDQLTKEALAGVSVRVKNGSAAVISDAAGKFTITARSTDILVAQFLGYESQEQAVGTNTKVDFTLSKSLTNLDEVVVIGYGTQAKRDVTGSITSVNATQIAERTPINIYEALQGQSPGVQVDQASGAPGAETSVVIRGIGTLGVRSATPLYIVDGAQGVNIDGINPMDVESIDILKDAGSSAIYGAKGANGVIIITTKRGKSGKTDITANLVNSYGTLSHKVASSNADQRRLYNIKLASGSGTLPADSLNPASNADVDALDAVTRVAKKNDASVSISGGNQAVRFLGSFNYVADESVILNSWGKQGRLRMNVDFEATPRLTVNSNLLFDLRNGNTVQESSSLNEAYARNPLYALYLPDGSLAPTNAGRQNPVAWSLLRVNLGKTYNATIYNKAAYRFNKNLLWSTDITMTYKNAHNTTFIPNSLGGAGVTVNTGSDESTLNTFWQAQSFMNYTKNIGTNHTITGLIGVSADKSYSQQLKLSGNTWVSDLVLTLNSAQVYATPTTGDNASSNAAVFARVGYDFKKRYQLNGILRADGSSKFGPENRWGYFPSVTAGWTFSDEPFMSSITNKFLTSGRLRVSYGITGNNQVGSYDAIQQYTFGTNFYNGISGVVLSNKFGNPTLGWEVNKSFDIGTDLSLFKGRANVVVDYYDKITDKLLYSAPLVVETGYSSVNVNTGSIQNKGLEFLVGGYLVRNRSFQWNLSYNMSFNRGTVRELVNHTPILSGAGSYTQEGHRLGDFLGWRQLDVFAYDQSNAFDANWNRLTPVFNGTTFTGYTLNGAPYTGTVKKKQSNGVTAVGGDVDWEDLDKNGIIDDLDRSILGNAQPDWIAGVSNNFNYKSFNLAVVVYASMGANIYNAIDASQSDYHEDGVTPRPYIILHAWDKQGDITDVPDAKIGAAIGNTRAISSRYVEDASWVRLRNVKLSYTLPARLGGYIGAKRVAASISGNNLLTWSKYIGFDPEFALTDPLRMGVESASRIPRKNEWIFGLLLNF
jgi:TonB-linked SusC/RagA family outer membrane protein